MSHPDPTLAKFRSLVLTRGRELYRDLPWRNTRDPYEIWISEVMLQQTQVTRVDGRWQAWLMRFPTVTTLAHASAADVLEEWQGLGYNRRALALHRAAQAVEKNFHAQIPSDAQVLIGLPGIGPATAAGIRAFAFNAHSLYLETNVRTVFLHELFPGADKVSDAELKPLVDACCPPDGPTDNPTDGPNALGPGALGSDAPGTVVPGPDAPGTEAPSSAAYAAPTSGQDAIIDDPRTWYYALLDYGAYLKKTVPNPSRRSKSHVKQSRFEGSHRQKRAEVVRLLLAARPEALSLMELKAQLDQVECAADRPEVSPDELLSIMSELTAEGFCTEHAVPADTSDGITLATWSCE